GFADDLAQRMVDDGHRVHLVHARGCGADADAIARAVAAAVLALSDLDGVIHAWSLDAPPTETMTVDSLRAHDVPGCGALLHLVQTLPSMPGRPRLWIVTRNAQSVRPGAAPSLAQAPVWGFGRAIAVEHPEIWGGLIDLPPQRGVDDAACVLRELSAA